MLRTTRYHFASGLLIVLLTVLPPFCDVAQAQTAPVREPDAPMIIPDEVHFTLLDVQEPNFDGAHSSITGTIEYEGQTTDVQIVDGDIEFA
ncbi:MAG: hypothetical protein ACTHQM_21485, partial [Thermoanaerobaculia bacterium]